MLAEEGADAGRVLLVIVHCGGDFVRAQEGEEGAQLLVAAVL
jgi:hypothetical protein